MNDVKESVFGLVSKPDPNQLVAIRTREEVCDDPHLSDGAKVLFIRLLDLALNPHVNQGRKGQVIASQMKLACFLKCTERSIRRRITELVEKLLIWTTLIPRPNTKPILCYHITAFQPKEQTREEMPNDALWGNGRRRFDSGFERTGTEATGRQRRKGSALLDRFGNPVFSHLLENDTGRGREEPLRADKFVRSDRTQASSGSGQFCPLTADAVVLSQRSKLSAGSGQNCPQTTDVNVRLKETPVSVLVPTESKGTDAPPRIEGQGDGQYRAVEVPALVTPDDLIWKERLKKKFDDELRTLQADLKAKLKASKTENQRALVRWRVEAVEEILFGAPHPDEKSAAALLPAPTRLMPKRTGAKEMTPDELLDSARSAVELGARTLTDAQRQALRRVGELKK